MYQLRPRERAGGQIENTVGSRRAYLPVYMSRDDWGSSYLYPNCCLQFISVAASLTGVNPPEGEKGSSTRFSSRH